MFQRSYSGGPIGTMCYLVGDESAGEALVVDAPEGVADEVTAAARQAGLRIVLVANTHGHFDHVGDNATLVRLTGASLAIHSADAEMIRRPPELPIDLPFRVEPSEPTRLLAPGEQVLVGALRFEVLHTPGHTPGSICLFEPSEGALFSGDTLFAGGQGRTDLPGGDDEAMLDSLARLASLPAATRVYPGHGPATTIAAEWWLPRSEGRRR